MPGAGSVMAGPACEHGPKRIVLRIAILVDPSPKPGVDDRAVTRQAGHDGVRCRGEDRAQLGARRGSAEVQPVTCSIGGVGPGKD